MGETKWLENQDTYIPQNVLGIIRRRPGRGGGKQKNNETWVFMGQPEVNTPVGT